MNVTLRQLRVFQSVARTRNFSRTGEAIGLTQPAVSRAIGELERALGLRLLDRTTREVALTEAGRSLAARLDRALDELDATLADVAGLADADGGKVRVASSPTLSAYLMPACIAACARAAPRVRFVLLDRIQQDVLASVRGGEVDFGVVVEPPEVDDLHCEAILHDPFVLVTPQRHRLARAAERALEGARRRSRWCCWTRPRAAAATSTTRWRGTARTARSNRSCRIRPPCSRWSRPASASP